MSHNYDHDFESAGSDIEEDIIDETPFEVNVNMMGGGDGVSYLADSDTAGGEATGRDAQWDSDEEGNDLELHGRAGRMKLSKKPPEVLLRQYRNNINNALERGEKELAIEDLVRCTALARIVYGDCDWRFAESEAQLAEAYWKHRNLAPQAQQHAEEARNIMLRVVQAGGAQQDRKHIYRTLLSVYITLGEAFNAQQKYTDAELSFQKAEKILMEQKKALQSKVMSAGDEEQDHDLKSELRVAQAKLAANQSKAAAAIAYFEEAITLIQQEYGDDSLKLIPLYQMVGRVEQNRDTAANHMKSIEAYLQAHSIANANYSEGTEELAETGFQLALAYTRAASQDKDAETSAESYLNECLATYQSLHGPNHEKTIQCQDELSRLMIRTERPDEAIELLRSTLSARRETYGEYSQSLASAYKLLGSVHMSQGNMEKSLKSMNKELSDAEQQYRALQQQHLSQLQTALEEKDRQLNEGRALFDQLKRDFKYNLRLLQERDEELEQTDVTLSELRAELDRQMNMVSAQGVRLSEGECQRQQLSNKLSCEEAEHRQQVQTDRAECDRRLQVLRSEQNQYRLEWESEKRALEQNLKICEELRVSEKREAQILFEDQLSQRESDWRSRMENLESETLSHQLRVTSLNKETEKLREDHTMKSQIVESSEAAQRRLENELKQVRWELEDYRSMCTRRIQDLEANIGTAEQSQKALVEKYERKEVQAEARIREMTDRKEKIEIFHNEHVKELNASVKLLKEKLSDSETEKARLHWKIEDINSEKSKIIGSHAVEKTKLEEQIQKLESDVSNNVIKEELTHLKRSLQSTKEELATKTKDIEKYQQQLVQSTDQITETERQRARLELDCQKKCEQIERDGYQKSEKLIASLSQSRDKAEATIKRLEKEGALHQQAINQLKADRDDAYKTLHNNGITLQIAQTTDAYMSPPRAVANAQMTKLKVQNDSLKQVIAQMRQEMEGVVNQGTSVSSPLARDSAYVKSLEEEITQLKQHLRSQVREEGSKHLPSLDADNLPQKNPAVQQVVVSLNATISSLRSEKIELTAAGRKQQIEIEHLKAQMGKLKAGPRNAEIELEQARYELNATNRKLASDTSSLRQRVAELERQLESTREETAEYHRSVLTVSAENQALSTELSQLKISQARSGEVINYGAQELVIQNLQDENERLRLMIQKSSPGQAAGSELNKALSRVSQLTKEKAILTELSNKLRSELHKAGVDVKKPPGARGSGQPQGAVPEGHAFASEDKLSDAVRGKLDQLERLQYQLTKAHINKVSEKPSQSAGTENQLPTDDQITRPQHSYPRPHRSVRPASPPTKLQKHSNLNTRVSASAKPKLPAYIEQSSTTSSSLKAQGHTANLQQHQPSSKKYIPPAAKSKQKSNLAWIKRGEGGFGGQSKMTDQKTIHNASKLGQVDENSMRRSLNSTGHRSPSPRLRGSAFIDSMDLGSSIQDVWKLLDNHPPSLSSSTPDQ